LRILRAIEPDHLRAAHFLIREYVESLGEACCGLQEFQPDLTELPGPYGPPFGALLLALEVDDAAGCVGLRRFEPSIAEMKRLYVRPSYRGRGVGRELVSRVIESARGLGYAQVRLDTVPTMENAIALYRSLGFRVIPPYRKSHDPSALFFELEIG
jgi:ribosomal protein S18 acetylase RimI-like enzyme